jgi:hypothetical protein
VEGGVGAEPRGGSLPVWLENHRKLVSGNLVRKKSSQGSGSSCGRWVQRVCIVLDRLKWQLSEVCFEIMYTITFLRRLDWQADCYVV